MFNSTISRARLLSRNQKKLINSISNYSKTDFFPSEWTRAKRCCYLFTLFRNHFNKKRARGKITRRHRCSFTSGTHTESIFLALLVGRPIFPHKIYEVTRSASLHQEAFGLDDSKCSLDIAIKKWYRFWSRGTVFAERHSVSLCPVFLRELQFPWGRSQHCPRHSVLIWPICWIQHKGLDIAEDACWVSRETNEGDVP